MDRRKYLSAVGVAFSTAALAGCSSSGDDETDNGGTSGSDDEETNGGDDEMDLFGAAASIDGETSPLDGSVERNVLSGFEVVDHVGVYNQESQGPVISARIENVGSETVRLTEGISQRAILYGPDGEQVDEIGSLSTTTQEQDTGGVPPGETAIMNILGGGYESVDISRYGIVLDCRDEPTRDDARSPYCPEP